ncbi:cytochrome P450 [Mycena rosella]|uniref:Cytochrome P450 n=1 Tax=Mycena rosella TaxID=1033263 RepID=A0AAD7CUS6_MYCRO|nr:cytochrome P450 [Mycena rosella]
MLAQLFLSAFGTLLSYALFQLVKFLYDQYASPLRGMVGPRNPSLLLGHFKELEEDSMLTEKWKAQYGLNFQMKGLFSVRELYTADTKALSHIAVHTDTYQKPAFVRYHLAQIVGEGLLVVEGDDHRRQNPAFGVPQIRELTSVFVDKSHQLRDIWASEIAPAVGGSARIEVLSWVSKMTLDVIGQAGFNYQFNALDPAAKPSELNKVFSQIFHAPRSSLQKGLRLAQAIVPILRVLPVPWNRLLEQAQDGMARIGQELLEETRTSLESGVDTKRRDLLSLLLKGNAGEKIPLSDKELVSQLPAFFVAGHETTSTATAWALYALARNRGAQQKLRAELLTVDTEDPTLDELNALPYLESVIRETLRAHSPVAFTARVAMEDDVLPLRRPYLDRAGRAHESLRVSKGQVIHIPILDVNTDTEIWGDDAAEFRPERWEDVPDAATAVPGVWAHLFTFLAGPRNCIGFRFALAEMKALLFVLIRAFEFEMAVPEGDVGRTNTPVQRPMVLSEKATGAQMPLIVKPYREEA